MFLLILLGTVVFLVLYFLVSYTKFSRYGVKHFKPTVPFGNMGPIITRKEHFANSMKKLYDAFPGERFVGRYEFVSTVIILKDLELVKKITVKDFEHFLDHRSLVDENNDPLFGRNLFSMKGQEWKDMRSTLSPAFTSSKLRLMVPFIREVGDQMVKSLKDKLKASKDDFIDIDSKDLATRSANDVIASCAFGLKVDSHMEPDNEFYTMGKAASTYNFKQIITAKACAKMPRKLIKKLKLTMFSEAVTKFFFKLIVNTMSDREERNLIRPDMIHLLMEAKKGHLTHEDKVKDADAGFATVEESAVGKKNITREWNDYDLVAQAVLFFIAGYKTVSSTITFIMHELALNSEVQERLAQEIKEADLKNGGKIDYTSIMQMTYLDMVVSEALRLWPPAGILDRLCVKDYNLGKANPKAKDYIIRKGESVQIPVWAIHHDPELFPDPLRFDPERFSEENKHNIKPSTYLPFGAGPRNCLGSRFALCEVKMMVYLLLLNVQLSPATKTQLNAELSTETVNMEIKGGHWVRVRARE